MRVVMRELCDDLTYIAIPEDHKVNLYRLLYVLNSFAHHSGLPLIVNSVQMGRRMSGYRTPQMQREIYRGKPHVPMSSFHLLGAAADVLDREGHWKKWILDHLELAERHDVYFEAFERTPTWTHFQIYPPKSGKRFFEP